MRTNLRNSAFDTETVDGNIVVIAWSDGHFIEFPALDEIFETFMQSKYRRLFCYNLRFDSDSVLKMLPLENIAELMDDKETVYKHWRLHILGGNSVVIRDIDVQGSQTKLWDLAQMYKYLKLKVAAEEYLPAGESKLESDVINTFVDSQEGQNTIEYYKKHHNEINEYCIIDARITKLLADVFQEACNVEGYDFRQPYSLGNMAIKWFRPYLKNPAYPQDTIPRIHPAFWRDENPGRRTIETVMNDLARGGWNDCFKRGHFEGAYDYDIVSAYPTIMHDISYWAGRWQEIDSEDKIGDAEYGYLFVTIKNLEQPLLPEAYYYFDETYYRGKIIKRVNNSVLHCAVGGDAIDTTITLDQWRYLKNLADIEVFEGVVLRPEFDMFPLREPVEELTKRKQRAAKEKGKKSPEYWIAKTIMNSTSGKFKQKFHTDRTWFYYPHVYGKITWKTKEIMADLVTENDAWDKIVSVSTDGAVFTEKLHNVDLSGELGSFEENQYRDFTQIGNGIYFGTTVDGEVKQRMRGFQMSLKKMKGQTLEELIRSNPKASQFEFPMYRPLHLRECYKHNKVWKISDTNRFVPIIRHLNINKEIKREWLGRFEDVEDMMSGRILESKPWSIRTARQLSKAAEKRIRKELDIEGKQTDLEDYK